MTGIHPCRLGKTPPPARVSVVTRVWVSPECGRHPSVGVTTRSNSSGVGQGSLVLLWGHVLAVTVAATFPGGLVTPSYASLSELPHCFLGPFFNIFLIFMLICSSTFNAA